VVRRRRALALIGVALTFSILVFALLRSSGGSGPKRLDAAATARGSGHASTAAKSQPRSTPAVSPLRRVPPGPPSDQRRLTLLETIAGHISPKSVAATGAGLVFAQNMMYTHTDTVYNSSGKLRKTIPDTVDMSKFGIQGHPGITHGAPVEAAVTPDANHVYLSNYSMYGSGFGPEGNDTCTPASAEAAGDTDSYVYRISTSALAIDQVIKVGLVPKFLTVTPNGKYVLVANWCSFDLSVINVAQGREVARLPMGAYPRGLAVSPDSKTAYVAIMGSDVVNKVDLGTLEPEASFAVGANPRHLVISPDGHYLYVSLNGPGEVAKVDLGDDSVVATAHTGVQDRSLAISADGRSLYVVNYDSDTVTKLRASDLSVLQNFSTGVHPIGVTYDASTGKVWVAVYSGQILVLADRKPA
jgi:YVTN family beta-propeller protein